jgi:hypothetical protein
MLLTPSQGDETVVIKDSIIVANETFYCLCRLALGPHLPLTASSSSLPLLTALCFCFFIISPFRWLCEHYSKQVLITVRAAPTSCFVGSSCYGLCLGAKRRNLQPLVFRDYYRRWASYCWLMITRATTSLVPWSFGSTIYYCVLSISE